MSFFELPYMDGRATVVFIGDCPWDQLLADAQIMGDREMVERILRVVHVDPDLVQKPFVAAIQPFGMLKWSRRPCGLEIQSKIAYGLM